MQDSERPDEQSKSNEEWDSLFQNYADAVESENIEEQERAVLEVWQKMSEIDDEPSPWLIAMTEAHECEAAFDWEGAEAAYKRAVTAEENTGLQSKAYESLASLYYLLDRDELALKADQEANRLALLDPISVLAVFAFISEAGCFLRNDDFAGAEQALNEAFARIEEGPMHHLLRAYALIQRAKYFIKLKDFEAAKRDLSIAWPLIEPHADFFYAAGWQNAIGSWWAATAQMREREDQDWEAMKAHKEVVARRRIIAQLPQLEGPYKHNSLAVALRDFGLSLRAVDNALAADAFKESRMIRRSIGLPPLKEH